MNLLQNSNEQNSKALKEILEIEMKERLRYPKYTIIQNTPLTPHEEIMNQIIEKKLGPSNSYSMNYPSVVFKNQNEINEQINHLTLNLNPNETNNNQNPLINVYSNITSPKSSSSNSVQKLSELEEKLKEINLNNQNIDNYYKSIKTENQGIIPQIRRM